MNMRLVEPLEACMVVLELIVSDVRLDIVVVPVVSMSVSAT